MGTHRCQQSLNVLHFMVVSLPDKADGKAEMM